MKLYGITPVLVAVACSAFIFTLCFAQKQVSSSNFGKQGGLESNLNTRKTLLVTEKEDILNRRTFTDLPASTARVFTRKTTSLPKSHVTISEKTTKTLETQSSEIEHTTSPKNLPGLFRKKTTTQPKPAPTRREFTIPTSAFTINLYKALRKAIGHRNVFFSPWSISVGLGMLLNGADGITEQRLQEGLGLKRVDTKSINEKFTSILTNLQGNEVSYNLENGNGVYVSDSVLLNPRYVSTLEKVFGVSPQQFNFLNESEEAITMINNFVSEKTRNLISEFLSPGSLPLSTLLYLLNVIYFSGKWRTPFPAADTRSAPFHKLDDSTVNVEMMHLETDLQIKYIKHLDSDMVILPYQGDRIKMMLLVPRLSFGILSLEKYIDEDTLRYLLSKVKTLAKTDAFITLPKFTIATEINLKEILYKLGFGDLFLAPNLSKMSNDSLFVSEAVHKAVVEVNEEGSKAAAVTGLSIGLRFGITKPLVVEADHPFVFIIYDSLTETLLFVGSVFSPV